MQTKMTSGGRIIHYTHASASGAARYVFELVRSLHEQRMPVELVCPHDFAFLPELRASPDLAVSPVLPSLLGAGGKLGLVGRMLRQTLAGLGAVLRRAPDAHAVHVNFPGVTALILPLFLVLRLLGVKLVYTVHDVLPHRWLLPARLRGLEHALLWLTYRLPTHLVVHFDGARADLSARFGVPRERISVIPHGAFPLADEASAERGAREVTALMFGAIRQNKNVHLAIEAVQRLRARRLPLRLRIAGAASAGERAYWESCKQLWQRAPDGIDVTEGFVPDAALPALLAEADLVLLPYQDFHSQSGVAALALSNARPVIVSAAGGLANVAAEPWTLPLTSTTVEGLETALLHAVDLGSDQLARLGREAKRAFLQRFGWSAVAKCYPPVYGLESRATADS